MVGWCVDVMVECYDVKICIFFSLCVVLLR